MNEPYLPSLSVETLTIHGVGYIQGSFLDRNGVVHRHTVKVKTTGPQASLSCRDLADGLRGLADWLQAKELAQESAE